VFSNLEVYRCFKIRLAFNAKLFQLLASSESQFIWIALAEKDGTRVFTFVSIQNGIKIQ
jgi:hypothetical protein